MKKAEQWVRLSRKDVGGGRQRSITRTFVRSVNEYGLYPEGEGEERRNVTRHAFGKHHCGHCIHSR